MSGQTGVSLRSAGSNRDGYLFVMYLFPHADSAIRPAPKRIIAEGSGTLGGSEYPVYPHSPGPTVVSPDVLRFEKKPEHELGVSAR